MSIGRNDPCPCQSGRKAKKCHSEVVGWKEEEARWYLGHLLFIETIDGYREPMSQIERNVWKTTGCPFGTCDNETDVGVACASGCGV